MIWALPFIPALAGLAIWAWGPSARTAGAAAGAAAVVTALLALLVGSDTVSVAWSETISLRAGLTPQARVVAVTVALVALPILIFAAASEAARGLARLIGLLLVFVGGMELIVIAADFVTLLIGWEIVGACSWALIGHRWREGRPVASANYAFVMTRFGDLGLFVALFTVFAATGETGYDALGALEGPSLALAGAGILVAAVSKAGQVPFAPWLFRAMDGPTPVSALLHSATMVAAGVYLLARLQPALAGAPGFAVAAMAVGLVTALAGGVEALRQMHAKKLLAGSTSAQMGLMIATVGAGFPGIAILHLVVHAVFKAALFVSAGAAHHASGGFDLRAMSLGRAMPWAAAATGLAALSLAAVPPLAGGWSKEEMVKALEHAGAVPAILVVVAGGLTAAYAARFAWMSFGPGEVRDPRPTAGTAVALGLLSVATLALSFLWFPDIHDLAARVLGAELPEGSRLGLIASLAAVALGVMAGLSMARQPGAAPSADWLGLPRLIETVVTGPFEALARAAALADDRAIDGQDAAAGRATASARGAVAGIVGATGGLSRAASRGGEALSDLVATGPGHVAGRSGSDARKLQTGLAHHYYAYLIAGALLGIGVLLFGG
ncbi:NADH-quinone oxidoreductase subunit 5 family protein [Roseivivax marinus]|uniref:NADH-quinone oxidoreductase subunit 5 family protein n=1 Tax=Roseivivax marinus TaxID=1379903 RepID=UPI00273E9DA3|nr:proton-conducting transporter membrane subunit [Roseivivax marinus]